MTDENETNEDEQFEYTPTEAEEIAIAEKMEAVAAVNRQHLDTVHQVPEFGTPSGVKYISWCDANLRVCRMIDARRIVYIEVTYTPKYVPKIDGAKPRDAYLAVEIQMADLPGETEFQQVSIYITDEPEKHRYTFLPNFADFMSSNATTLYLP